MTRIQIASLLLLFSTSAVVAAAVMPAESDHDPEATPPSASALIESQAEKTPLEGEQAAN